MRVGDRAERLEPAALVPILSLAALLRWEMLGARSLWFDEGYSLFVAGLGPRGILDFLHAHDAHPAGYYIVLSWWLDVFGDSILTARILSLLVGVVAVTLTWWLGRTLFSYRVGLAAALLVAIHPFQVMASNEIRMYMPLALVSLLSTWVLLEGIAARVIPLDVGGVRGGRGRDGLPQLLRGPRGGRAGAVDSAGAPSRGRVGSCVGRGRRCDPVRAVAALPHGVRGQKPAGVLSPSGLAGISRPVAGHPDIPWVPVRYRDLPRLLPTDLEGLRAPGRAVRGPGSGRGAAWDESTAALGTS